MILNRTSSVVAARVNPSNTPIQQIKAAGITFRGQSSQGLPLPVGQLSVAVTKSGVNRILRVSFVENPSDPYFVNAQLFIELNNGPAELLATGHSPIVVTVRSATVPASLTVVSNGNWGTATIETSPSVAVSLA